MSTFVIRSLIGLIVPAILQAGTEAADFRKLFKEADPAVLVLNTIEREVAPRSRLGEVALPGLGSAFLIDAEGHVMTAAHVVQTADLIAEISFCPLAELRLPRT